GDYAFLAVGRFLYRSPALTAGAWADFVQVADVGAGRTIGRLAYYRGDLLLCCGLGLDVQRFTYPAGPLATFSAGLKAKIGIGYARQLVYGDPSAGNEDVLKMTTGASPDSRELDAPIVNMGIYDGQVAIATRQSLWLLGGRPDPTTNKWTQEPQPFFTQGVWNADDDFLFLLEYGGRLYTWLANQVMYWEPNEPRQGWRAAGLEGRTCHGAAVAGNMLVVCCTTRTGASETWAFDGSGWWLLLRTVSQTRVWPMHTGGAGTYDLAVFRDGAAGVTYDLFRMVWRSATLHTYPATATYLTSLLDAGERDKPKAWRKLGATFAVPEARGNQASADPVTVALSFSIDGGKTFTQVASASPSDPTGRVLELSGEPAAPAVGHWVQLRATWTSVLDWAPVLTGLWAEYELLDAPARRRRWRFKVHARDGTVQRDGAVASRSGRQLAADLWAAWAAGATVPFTDLDFDLTAKTYQVRIVGIAEEVAKPADGGRWGEAVLALTLVEV
ncbi:MAG TPA: hypothetical protein VHA34_03270, partial [Actinomycetes bacterium]|nr:hypothetical protein [Actinomycetes bacterium]